MLRFRAIFSAVERLMRQLHLLTQQRKGPFEGEFEEFLDWVVSTPCANHDAQNSLQWSLKGFLEDSKQGLKDFFIVVESLRNAYDLLLTHLDTWLRLNTKFEDAPFDEEVVREWWTAMGFEGESLENLVSLNPVWRDGALWINIAWAEDLELWERLSAAMLLIFHFRKFTESRWTTVGKVCKSIIAALSVGLAELVAYIREDPKSSEYHIHGFDNLTDELRICWGETLIHTNGYWGGPSMFMHGGPRLPIK